MGTTGSIGFYIDVDTANHQSGDLIKGTVFMLVRKEVPSTNVLLCLKGTEKTGWNEIVRKGKNFSIESRRGKNRSLRQRFVLHTFPAPAIPVGQYSFPFAIQTTQGLKPSFRYLQLFSIKDCGKVYGKIEYELIAKLEVGPEAPGKGKCVINFTKVKPIIDVPITGEAAATVSSWYCAGRGKMRVKARVAKSDFWAGDSTTVTMEVDNTECKLDTKEYSVSIKREIRLLSDAGQAHFLRRTINSSAIPVCVKAGASSETSRQTLEVTLPADNDVKHACTVSGTKVQCRYSLEAKVNISGSLVFCGEKAIVAQDVDVYPPDIEKEPPPTIDFAWNPKVMPAKEFTVSPENDYTAVPSVDQEDDFHINLPAIL